MLARGLLLEVAAYPEAVVAAILLFGDLIQSVCNKLIRRVALPALASVVQRAKQLVFFRASPLEAVPLLKPVATGLCDFPPEMLQQQLRLFDVVEDWLWFVDVVLVVYAEQPKSVGVVEAIAYRHIRYCAGGRLPECLLGLAVGLRPASGLRSSTEYAFS